MKTQTREVQKYRFWASSRTHDVAEEKTMVFEIGSSESFIQDCFEEWLDDIARQYYYLKGQYEPVGTPYTQKIIRVPLCTIDNRIPATRAFDYFRNGEDMVFIVDEQEQKG